MLLSPGAIIGAIIKGLMLSIFLKMIIAWIVSFAAIGMIIYPKPNNKDILKSSSIIALAGTLVFQLPLWFPGGLIGLILSIVVFWVLVSSVLDRFFDIHYDQSYAYTGQIVMISILIWLVAGLAINMLLNGSN